MIDTADPDRVQRKRELPSPFLPLLASLNPERGTANFPSTSVLLFVPVARSLPPDSSGTLSENEKAPPPPPEFSPVTIGSLARGTNSGLHDAGPFQPPPPYGGPSVFLDPSCDLPSPPISPTPLSSCRHGL